MIEPLEIEELRILVNGKTLQKGEQKFIRQVVIDSRNIVSDNNSLFIAIQGPNHDGHDFVLAAYRAGVRSFLVRESWRPPSAFPGATFLTVADTLEALQKIAQRNRAMFHSPVLGITGSNGKTIVKEWLGQVLGKNRSIAKSPKSYNSQVGVPLSVLGNESYHKLAIMEAGISRPSEMDRLEKMIRPSLGLFTNLGTAHEEGFADRNEKIQEKAKLFSNSQYIIYRKDQEEVAGFLEEKFTPDRLISWSDLPGADYVLSIKKTPGGTKILLLQPDLSLFTFHTKFTDDASLENLRHVIIACMTLGLSTGEINKGIQDLRPVEMRLSVKQGINNSIIIDDTYNNDLAGLRIALEFLSQQRPKKRKILILSDLLQTGDPQQVYLEIAALAKHYRLDLLFGVGREIQQLGQAFSGKALFFPDTESLMRVLEPGNFGDDLILIKGARKFGFEKVVDRLQEKVHGTVLEIDLNALSHNYNFYKQRLSPGTKVMVMVKAFAYGGGSAEIANHLQQQQADYLAVAYADEGIYLRKQGIRLPIMVLHPEREAFDLLKRHDLEPVVYSLELFRQLAAYCRDQNLNINIHLDLDTGMRRLGLEKEHIHELNQLVQQSPEIRIASMFTHLVAAEDAAHDGFTREQVATFIACCRKIESTLPYQPLKHVLNSAGIIRYPEFQFDMVRLGIGLYGFEVTGEHAQSLQPISTLKTTIYQIKRLAKGETVGYGRKGVMPEEGLIATIPIGYADGYDRRFGNGKGFVSVNGQLAPVIGNVCMDMCMINITGIDAREGDEVIIYGKDISLKTLADAIGTIPYELLTGISNRVKRIYFLD